MLPIFWTQKALDDLDSIADFVGEQSEIAAERIRSAIEASIEPASSMPYMFRSGRVEGTREVVSLPNYILVYRVAAERIEVIAVLHARQKYPPDRSS